MREGLTKQPWRRALQIGGETEYLACHYRFEVFSSEEASTAHYFERVLTEPLYAITHNIQVQDAVFAYGVYSVPWRETPEWFSGGSYMCFLFRNEIHMLKGQEGEKRYGRPF
jgi:hypothetical protein